MTTGQQLVYTVLLAVGAAMVVSVAALAVAAWLDGTHWFWLQLLVLGEALWGLGYMLRDWRHRR